MLLYRTQLSEAGATIVAVAVRLRPDAPGLGTAGAGGAGALFRVMVRYAGAGGRMQTHRGVLYADLPPGRRLRVAGYQQSGSELLISLQPVAPPERSEGGAVLADRFRLPVGLQAWGVTAVQGADLDLQAVCRGRGDSVLVRGALRLTLQTAGAPFRLRIPFCRVLAAEGAEGLRWRALAGVTGLHLKVEPGGRIEGEAVVALRCEGRPPGAHPGKPLPELHRVRELSGQVARVTAEPAGEGHALVQGLVALDLYWFDAAGRSRWTGRQVPFGALAAVEGLAPQDRLEVTAVLERLHHRVEGGEVTADLIISAMVTALRPEVAQMGAGCYRLERVVGSAATTMEVGTRFFDAPDDDPVGGARTVDGALPLAGPAAGWEELAAVLSGPEPAGPAVGAGEGRWTVRAALGGTPAGERPYPAPLKAAASGSVSLAPRDVLAVVPGLAQVDAAGLRLRTRLAWGPPLPAAGPGPGAATRTAGGSLGLPGPVRSVVAVAAGGGGRVRALVALEPRGLALVEGIVDARAGGRPLRLTAIPVVHGGTWRLDVTIELAVPDP